METALKTTPIPRVSSITADQLRQYFAAKSLPVIVENFASEELIESAAPQKLAAAASPDTKIEVVETPVGEYAYQPRLMSIPEFVTHLQSETRDNPCYAAQQPLASYPSLDDNDELTYSRFEDGLRPTWVWLGSAGSNIGLHWDNADSLLLQLWGKKRFLLAPFEDSGRVYPYASDMTRSPVDLTAVDPATHPRVLDVQFWSGELCPGELLFLPHGTWHQFWGVSESVSANGFLQTDKMRLSKVGEFMRLNGLRYSAGILWQMYNYGLRGRPFETNDDGYPPAGYMLWRAYAPTWITKRLGSSSR